MQLWSIIINMPFVALVLFNSFLNTQLIDIFIKKTLKRHLTQNLRGKEKLRFLRIAYF